LSEYISNIDVPPEILHIIISCITQIGLHTDPHEDFGGNRLTENTWTIFINRLRGTSRQWDWMTYPPIKLIPAQGPTIWELLDLIRGKLNAILDQCLIMI